MMASFIELPAVVRRRIYTLTGLVPSGDEIYLHPQYSHRQLQALGVQAQHTWQYARALDLIHDAWALDLTSWMSLLLTCKIINAEVSHLLFTTNHFHAFHLSSLSKLPASALRSLRSLKLSLNIARQGAFHGNLCSQPPEEYSLLDSSKSRDKTLLMEWKTTAEYMGPHIEPNSLDFRFICDVANQATAELAVEPFRHLPTLSNCELRLAHKADRRLQIMAQETASRAVAARPAHIWGSFRLMALPMEVCLRILEFTDLITPLRRIFWDDKFQKYRSERSLRARPRGPSSDMWGPIIHDYGTNAGKARCQKCHDSAGVYGTATRLDCSACRHACQFRRCRCRLVKGWEFPNGCFCSRYHSSYSKHCNCWRPPTPLFLVSRRFSEVAQSLFFSANRFTVRWSYLGSHYDRAFQALARVVPPSSRCHLRSLSVHLPGTHESNLPSPILNIKDEFRSLQCLEIETTWNVTERSHQNLLGLSFVEESDIDTMRQAVKLHWPVQDLGTYNSLKLFVLSLHFPVARSIYYLRHRGEPLPKSVVDLEDMQPDEGHIERTARLGDGDQPNWIEGIWVSNSHRIRAMNPPNRNRA